MFSYCLIGIMIYLAESTKITVQDLSSKYELSSRTIIRYLDILETNGIPLIRTRGNGGGISLPENFNMRSLLLTEQERKYLKAILLSSSTNESQSLITKLHIS